MFYILLSLLDVALQTYVSLIKMFHRGEKKVICNKFKQNSAVTCLAWPTEGPIIAGLVDGKVRAAFIKTHKVQTLYTADAMTIALATK